MKNLHITLDENSSAIKWANSQADRLGARGHVGTHVDCYTTQPSQTEYEITAVVLDCKDKMPDAADIRKISSLENGGLILHTRNLQNNEYGTERYFAEEAFLTEETLNLILSKKPLFLIIDSHGIAEKGKKHISFDKLCESCGCHVIENADLSVIENQSQVKLKIVIDIDHPSTGKPCKLYLL